MLIQAGSSSVLLDSGINPGAQDPTSAYPRFDTDEFDLEKLDAVVISHAHLDHCGILPFLYKYGYDGPVYCSEPTQTLMTLHQLDYLDVLYDADTAIRLARLVQACDLQHFEQPVAARDLAGMARVRREAGGVPIMADESILDHASLIAVIKADAA